MKQLAIILLLSTPLLLQAQKESHSLQKLWETDTIVAVPESIHPVPGKPQLYVSLIDGAGWDDDGKGGVGLLNTDGTHYNGSWVTGLSAPKGMGVYQNRLYVADITRVVVIDRNKGRILKKIPIEGSVNLNDISVDKTNGYIYLSDSKAGKLYRIANDTPTLYMEDLPGINGLKVSRKGLYILAKKQVLLADASKNIQKIADLPNGGDGVEEVGNGDLIVSEWLGNVFYVHADGEKEQLLDRKAEHKNTADIWYVQSTHTLYVPGFNGKTVTAYRLLVSPTPPVLSWDGSRLSSWREKARAGDTLARRLVNGLRVQADKLLDMLPLSVMDKTITPISGNKHDYMSQAPYFWYDSSKPNGLPYIRRDGERNPEIYKIPDHSNLADLGGALQQLSLCWYLTGEKKYSDKAALLLRRWFLDTATKMNPHLDYGQAIPGVNNGRGIGIIETIPLIGIADAALLLENSPSWPSADAKDLRAWYTQYLHWMLTSKNGREEHAAANNHGTWYLAQATDFALFTGDTSAARRLAEEGKSKMDHQIAGDGRMGEELARTNGLHYSTYNLQAFFTLARVARRTGVDLWQYTNGQNGSIHAALSWLLPYALGEKKWDYEQINSYNKDEIYGLLLQASPVYEDASYLSAAKQIHPERGNEMTELAWGK